VGARITLPGPSMTSADVVPVGTRSSPEKPTVTFVAPASIRLPFASASASELIRNRMYPLTGSNTPPMVMLPPASSAVLAAILRSPEVPSARPSLSTIRPATISVPPV
jgi:hypothetical protein